MGDEGREKVKDLVKDFGEWGKRGGESKGFGKGFWGMGEERRKK